MFRKLISSLMWGHLAQSYGDKISFSIKPQLLFIAAYGITPDGLYPTPSSAGTIEVLNNLVNATCSKYTVLISNAYPEIGIKEYSHKMALIDLKNGREVICRPFFMQKRGNTFIEVETIVTYMRKHGIEEIGLIAEYDHMPRLIRSLLEMLPTISVRPYTFVAEPSRHKRDPWIKGWSNAKLFWIWWHLLFYILAPTLIKKR